MVSKEELKKIMNRTYGTKQYKPSLYNDWLKTWLKGAKRIFNSRKDKQFFPANNRLELYKSERDKTSVYKEYLIMWSMYETEEWQFIPLNKEELRAIFRHTIGEEL